MIPVTPLLPVQPVGAVSPAVPMDAFRSAMSAAGSALLADPGHMAQAVTGAAASFQHKTAHMQAAVQSLTAPASLGAAAPARASAPSVPGDAKPDPLAPLQQSQAQAVSVMMETYDFALQASSVSHAATTFTSSVNTLIKTQ